MSNCETCFLWGLTRQMMTTLRQTGVAYVLIPLALIQTEGVLQKKKMDECIYISVPDTATAYSLCAWSVQQQDVWILPLAIDSYTNSILRGGY